MSFGVYIGEQKPKSVLASSAFFLGVSFLVGLASTLFDPQKNKINSRSFVVSLIRAICLVVALVGFTLIFGKLSEAYRILSYKTEISKGYLNFHSFLELAVILIISLGSVYLYRKLARKQHLLSKQ